jgi:hypothetical protein
MSQASTNPSPNENQFPPPQISDLLVLTLTTAYGLTWMGALTSDPPSGGADWRARLDELATTLLPGLLFGVELFGFAVVVRELIRGRRLSSFAPGHWWFLITGPQYLLGGTHYLIAIAGSTWFENQQGLWRMIESLSDALFHLCFMVFWLCAAASVGGWPWRTAMGLKTLEQLNWFALHCFRSLRGFSWAPRIPSMHVFGLMGTIHIGQILSVILATAFDRYASIRRDWLHHLAAATIVAESLQFLFGGFGNYLIRWWSEMWFHFVG